MRVEEAVRLMAGIVLLLGIVLAHWVHPYWILLSVFVGLNLIQSVFTKWCLATTIFTKLGLKP
jgi:pheromone shutdown protein TraB